MLSRRAAGRIRVLQAHCCAQRPLSPQNRNAPPVLPTVVAPTLSSPATRAVTNQATPLPGYNAAPMLRSAATHAVTNQATPLSGYNAFSGDPVLVAITEHFGGGWGSSRLSSLGRDVGSVEWQQKSRNANAVPPRLETHDRFGNRRDAAEFHPAYHELMALGLESGAAAFAWEPEHRGKIGAHVIRGALMYLMYQLNPGVCCPITMTFAATPALEAGTRGGRKIPFLEEILHKLRLPGYSGADIPLQDKPAVTVGMSMTEKQGGSDVRANTTHATPLRPEDSGSGDEFELVGHKWFTSAPMSDGFLTLAHTQEGVSCFLVPRWLPMAHGTRNEGFQLQRLKDKMGDKSNASSEVEYRQARGWMIGAPGRGVRTIVDMVVHTRLDCVIGSAALMRQCAQLAVHHCAARRAFGKPLLDQPLMRSVLADLSIESEAAMTLWVRLAAALDGAAVGNSAERDFIRLATAVSKYWICKRAPAVAYEAMECHGGNGYVEEGPMASLFRQSPLNAIWEGSGNVICLDVLRAVAKEPASARALFAELDKSKDVAPPHYGDVVDDLRRTLLGNCDGDGDGTGSRSMRHLAGLEPGARSLVDRLAVCLQATTLFQHGDRMVADAFVATRLPDPKAHMAGSCLLPTHNLGALPGLVLEPDVVSALIDRVAVHGGKE